MRLALELAFVPKFTKYLYKQLGFSDSLKPTKITNISSWLNNLIKKLTTNDQ